MRTNCIRRESEKMPIIRKESFDDMSKRFTQDQTLFITNEALRIF